jgi:hypothetical protein
MYLILNGGERLWIQKQPEHFLQTIAMQRSLV